MDKIHSSTLYSTILLLLDFEMLARHYTLVYDKILSFNFLPLILFLPFFFNLERNLQYDSMVVWRMKR